MKGPLRIWREIADVQDVHPELTRASLSGGMQNSVGPVPGLLRNGTNYTPNS
jgi:hypothetical protein